MAARPSGNDASIDAGIEREIEMDQRNDFIEVFALVSRCGASPREVGKGLIIHKSFHFPGMGYARSRPSPNFRIGARGVLSDNARLAMQGC